MMNGQVDWEQLGMDTEKAYAKWRGEQNERLSANKARVNRWLRWSAEVQRLKPVGRVVAALHRTGLREGGKQGHSFWALMEITGLKRSVLQQRLERGIITGDIEKTEELDPQTQHKVSWYKWIGPRRAQ